MSASAQNISITVVVSGQPISVKVNVHQTLEHVIREALNETGNKGQGAADWELRTSDGLLLSEAQTVGAAGLVSGMTLYLSPRAGAGGATSF